MNRVPALIALAMAGTCVMAAPRLAAAQLPPADVTVVDASSADGLSVTVFAASSLGPALVPSVLIGVEVRGLSNLSLPRADRPRQIEVDLVAGSEGATPVRHAVVMPFTDGATVRRAAEQGVRVLTRMSLAAGYHALRVTVRDSGDRRTASVAHDLEVPNLMAGPLTMSDLVLSASGVGGVTYPEPEEDSLLPLVGRPPAGQRRFLRSEKVEVNAEVYEAPADDGFGGQLIITTGLLTPEGRVVRETIEYGSSETLPNGVFGYHHYTLVPIVSLPPGAYILRVHVSVDGGEAASRSIPITIVDR